MEKTKGSGGEHGRVEHGHRRVIVGPEEVPATRGAVNQDSGHIDLLGAFV